jgi:hypothetical protein
MNWRAVCRAKDLKSSAAGRAAGKLDAGDGE